MRRKHKEGIKKKDRYSNRNKRLQCEKGKIIRELGGGGTDRSNEHQCLDRNGMGLPMIYGGRYEGRTTLKSTELTQGEKINQTFPGLRVNSESAER